MVRLSHSLLVLSKPAQQKIAEDDEGAESVVIQSILAAERHRWEFVEVSL